MTTDFKPIEREQPADMCWREEPGRFALVGFSGSPGPEDLALLADEQLLQCVREGGVTTLLLPLERAAEVCGRHPGAEQERPLCWIRFEAPMAWNVVGFLARVTSHLAAAGVPIGAVCSFHRDHLFVHVEFRERTRAALAELYPEGDGPA